MTTNRLRNIGSSTVAVALLVAAIVTGVFARTSLEEEKVCPYDGVKFRFMGQGSGTVFGQQLDLKQVGPITSPWPIAVCPSNGFVFYKSKFDEAELEKLRPIVLSADYQATKNETPYYRAYWLIDRSGGSHSEASNFLLSATWQAYGEQYERYATELVNRLSQDIATTEGPQRRTFIVLQGELLRRLERFDEAARHFTRWRAELGSTSTEALMAAYELDLIARQDSDPHLVEDAIKEGEQDPAVWLARRTPTSVGGTLTRTNAFRFASFRSRPGFEWTADSMAIAGTEAPAKERTRHREYEYLVRFDLPTDSRTIIKTPVNWRAVARSRDGNTIVAIESTRATNSLLDTWRFLQIDSRSLEVRYAAPAVPFASEFFMSHDGKSLLVRAKEGLAAFDLGKEGLRPLKSPSFAKDADRWQLIAGDPTRPRAVILHDRSVYVWDYEKGTLEHQLRPEAWVHPWDGNWAEARYVADNQLIVMASMDHGGKYDLAVWDLGSERLISRQDVMARACQLAGSDDGKLLAVGCWGGLHLSRRGGFDALVEVLRAAEDQEIDEIAFSPDSTKLAARTMDALFVYSINP